MGRVFWGSGICWEADHETTQVGGWGTGGVGFLAVAGIVAIARSATRAASVFVILSSKIEDLFSIPPSVRWACLQKIGWREMRPNAMNATRRPSTALRIVGATSR